jgi:SAM-dependent methyltransferase
MSDLSHFNPTSRFRGLADQYARHRPDYPAEAIDLLVDRCGLKGDDILVDVGCGTGISTRLFAQRGVRVLGLDPNPEMLARALTAPLPAGIPAPTFLVGKAEATGLADGTATAVVAAQAFHWFNAPVALKEFHRILRHGGGVALMWNERDESDPFTAAFGDVIRTAPEAATVEGPRARAGEALSASPYFRDVERIDFGHAQELDEEGVLGRAFSSSYAPREPDAVAAFAAALRKVYARFQSEGRVSLRYQTSTYFARRR